MLSSLVYVFFSVGFINICWHVLVGVEFTPTQTERVQLCPTFKFTVHLSSDVGATCNYDKPSNAKTENYA